MHPEQIKAAMRMKGVSPTALADELDVAIASVSQVISGRAVSARIRKRIAEITGHSVEELWAPGEQRSSLRRTPAEVAAARSARAAA
mgnify:CR=1 FL=1